MYAVSQNSLPAGPRKGQCKALSFIQPIRSLKAIVSVFSQLSFFRVFFLSQFSSALDQLIHPGQYNIDDQHQAGTDGRLGDHSCPCHGTDGRTSPHRGRGGQPVHVSPLFEDDAAAYEAHSRNDLTNDPGDIAFSTGRHF